MLICEIPWFNGYGRHLTKKRTCQPWQEGNWQISGVGSDSPTALTASRLEGHQVAKDNMNEKILRCCKDIKIETPFCHRISLNPKLTNSIQGGQEYSCPTLLIWDSRNSTTRQHYFSHIQRNRKQGDTSISRWNNQSTRLVVAVQYLTMYPCCCSFRSVRVNLVALRIYLIPRVLFLCQAIAESLSQKG